MVKAISVDSATCNGRMAARGELKFNTDSERTLCNKVIHKGRERHELNPAAIEPKIFDTKAPFLIYIPPGPCISNYIKECKCIQKSAYN
jgi:hypothetical protein